MYQQLQGLPWTQDGFSETEDDALKWFSLLAIENENAAIQVVAMPWIRDAISETERDVLEWLRWIAKNSDTVAATVNDMPWVLDGITEIERDTLEWLSWLAHENESAAIQVVAMPWLQDTITDTEADVLEWLRWVSKNSGTVAATVNEFPWVLDGITDTERDAVEWLSWLAHEYESAAIRVIAMPWVHDNVIDTEVEAIMHITRLKDDDDEGGYSIIETILALPWVLDGITEMEAEFLDYIQRLDQDDHESAAAVLEMPFLKSLEYDDVLAIRGINRLEYQEDESMLPALLEHPTLRGGITDAQTTLVTAAGTIREAEEIRRMLNPGYAQIETLAKGSALTPNLKISIVRTGSQRESWTAEGVWDAVDFAERIMQQPLPISHVIVVLNDKSYGENYGGASHGFAFGYDPEREQPQDTYGAYSFQLGIIHETAHYFWRLDPDWVDEGHSKYLRVYVRP